MNRITSPLVLLLFTFLSGCSNSASEQYATYEVFLIQRTNKMVRLPPTGDAYHCRKGDRITIKFHHGGPSREFLDWNATATNIEMGNIEKDYSTLGNISLPKSHTFTANTIGTFAITFMTFLARKNVPMRTYKEWNSVQTEGKIILIVK